MKRHAIRVRESVATDTNLISLEGGAPEVVLDLDGTGVLSGSQGRVLSVVRELVAERELVSVVVATGVVPRRAKRSLSWTPGHQLTLRYVCCFGGVIVKHVRVRHGVSGEALRIHKGRPLEIVVANETDTDTTIHAVFFVDARALEVPAMQVQLVAGNWDVQSTPAHGFSTPQASPSTLEPPAPGDELKDTWTQRRADLLESGARPAPRIAVQPLERPSGSAWSAAKAMALVVDGVTVWRGPDHEVLDLARGLREKFQRYRPYAQLGVVTARVPAQGIARAAWQIPGRLRVHHVVPLGGITVDGARVARGLIPSRLPWSLEAEDERLELFLRNMGDSDIEGGVVLIATGKLQANAQGMQRNAP